MSRTIWLRLVSRASLWLLLAAACALGLTNRSVLAQRAPPTAAELRRAMVVSVDVPRSRKTAQVRGPHGGSWQPTAVTFGLDPSGQYVGDLRLVDLATNKVFLHRVFIRDEAGQWAVYHLVEDLVLRMRELFTPATRAAVPVSIRVEPTPGIEVLGNRDGSVTVDIGWYVRLAYTTQPPTPTSPASLASVPATTGLATGSTPTSTGTTQVTTGPTGWAY